MQGNRSYPGRPLAGVRRKGSVVRRTQEAPVDGNDFLCHYGITGQKWGIRRFQNEDRTLTEEGKRRYAKDPEPESKSWKKSEARYLSDDELRRRNNRLQAERQYKDLMTPQAEREREQRKKDIINKVIIGTAVSLAAVAMRGHWKQAASFIGKWGKRLFTKVRATVGTKSALSAASNKYLNPTGSGGMIGSAGQRLNSANRLFNYRPRINNAIPKTRAWPSIKA